MNNRSSMENKVWPVIVDGHAEDLHRRDREEASQIYRGVKAVCSSEDRGRSPSCQDRTGARVRLVGRCQLARISCFLAT